MNCFILSAKTPGANINFPFLAVYNNGSVMNVGQPASFDTFLGMAYAISKLSPFTTNITLHGKLLSPLYYKFYFSYYTSGHHIRQRGRNEN